MMSFSSSILFSAMSQFDLPITLKHDAKWAPPKEKVLFLKCRVS
jgi:hypothetical protein